jgi:hypothetical protein
MGEESYHFFSLIMGINLILIGAAAVAAASIGLFRKKLPISSPFVIFSGVGGPILLYIGILLIRST